MYNKIFIPLLLGIALFSAGCAIEDIIQTRVNNPNLSNHAAVEGNLPGEFWGLTTWRYEFNQLSQGYVGEHFARIELHFTRTSTNQFSIDGTVHYQDEDIVCRAYEPRDSLCDVATCEFTGTRDGVLIGEAVEVDGILTVNMEFASKEERPVEIMSVQCSSERIEILGGVVADTLQTEGGMVHQPWTLDVDNITFIDEISSDATESSGAKTATRQFNTSVQYGYGTGSGLFALYLNEPQ